MAKRYRLYAQWQTDTDHESSVKYTVHHGGGTSDIYADQRYNGSTWMPLGEFDMAPGLGHKIVLSHDSLDGKMTADAIRFEVIADLPAVVADAIKLVSNDGEDLTYVHSDHLGAPQKMTDKDRTVVWDASYLPFGEEDSLIGSAANDNRFPGQRLEAETGLHYNYFRDYDPTTGRYLQSDPIGLAGGINTYGYVGGNPVNETDPEGLCAGVCTGTVIVVTTGVKYGPRLWAMFKAFQALENTIPKAPPLLNEGVEDEDAKQCKAPERNDEKYVKPPTELDAFPEAKPSRPKTPKQGGNGLRKRWKDRKGNIYEWDYQHGKVEKYGKGGKHKGEFDPKTGKQTKPANRGRRVER